MREKEVEAYLVHCVKRAGGEVRKVQFVGRRGAPDRVVMLPPVEADGVEVFTAPIWVELKRPGGVVEPHQQREHERMRRMGQRVEVVDSFERVDEVLLA